MNTASSISPWTQGPFSSVAVVRAPEPREAREAEGATEQGGQDAEGLREPQDGIQVSRGALAASASQVSEKAERLASQVWQGDAIGVGLSAASAFPQIVHLLVAGQCDIAAALSDRTGLPVVSLGGDTAPEELVEKLRDPEFAEGFILHGVPDSASQADRLDEVLTCDGVTQRRVLSWEGAKGVSQALFDHYVNEGELWLLPGQAGSESQPDLETALEALKGLPALE